MVAGGSSALNANSLNTVEEYDPNINAWRQLAKPPIEINHFQAVLVGERIAVVGAFTGVYPHEQPVPNIWFFDSAKNEWSKGPEVPDARRRGGAPAKEKGPTSKPQEPSPPCPAPSPAAHRSRRT